MLSPKALALSSLLFASTTWAGIAGKTLRISPVGDSITQGAHDDLSVSIQGGYRGPLLNLLTGNTVNLVGSSMDGNIRDWNHEGWGGHSINQLSGHVNNALFAAPNVMLIHLGVNNIYPCTTAPNSTATPCPDMGPGPPGGCCPGGTGFQQRAQSDMTDLLNHVHAADPNILIILGLIGSKLDAQYDAQHGTTRDADVTTYNNFLKNFASTMVSQSNSNWHITTANIHDKLATSNEFGVVHPTDAGYNAMAQGWKDALDAVGFAYDSWYVAPRVPGNAGMNVCPTTTTAGSASSTNFDFSVSTTVSALATGPAVYFGTKCTDAGGNQCSCTDYSQPSPTGVAVPVYRSCAEMSNARTPAITFADINGDGRDDYLYLSPNGSVSSWLTTGSNYYYNGPIATGEFGAQIFTQSQGTVVSSPPSIAALPRVRLADFDGDGYDDYLVVEPSGQVTYFRNNKVFGASTSSTQDRTSFSTSGVIVFTAPVGGTYYPGAGIQFADLDGDGYDDLFYIANNGTITAFKNQGITGGKPTFSQTPVTIFSTPGFYTRDNIIVKDMDGDAKADLIIVNRNAPTANQPSGNFVVYPNLGGIASNSFGTTPFITQSALANDGSNVYFYDIAGSGKASWIQLQSTAGTLVTRTNWCTYDRAAESKRLRP